MSAVAYVADTVAPDWQEREPETLFVLPHGTAVVYGEPVAVPATHTQRMYASRAVRLYAEKSQERDRARERFAAVASGKRPSVFRAGRAPRGVTLGVCGTFEERQLRAYCETTGRNPRTIADYLRSRGVTDTARLERATAEWDGTAAPVLEESNVRASL